MLNKWITVNLLLIKGQKLIDRGKKELSMLFRPIYGDAADFEGGIEVELLPPLRWKHVRISLLPEDGRKSI
ncbi:hypothetical protein E7X23_24620 [Bacteroides fragilis]|nr:hypothetical protein E7X23_24620 [Bacteroides fragilis]